MTDHLYNKETIVLFPQINSQNFKLKVKIYSFLITLQEYLIINMSVSNQLRYFYQRFLIRGHIGEDTSGTNNFHWSYSGVCRNFLEMYLDCLGFKIGQTVKYLFVSKGMRVFFCNAIHKKGHGIIVISYFVLF